MKRRVSLYPSGDGSATLPSPQRKGAIMKIEFGDYYDNMEALRFAVQQLRQGLVREGLANLGELRDHIKRTEETKSQRYIIPNIEFFEEFVTQYNGYTGGQIRDNLARIAKLV
jgi:hypothetical protein